MPRRLTLGPLGKAGRATREAGAVDLDASGGTGAAAALTAPLPEDRGVGALAVRRPTTLPFTTVARPCMLPGGYWRKDRGRGASNPSRDGVKGREA